MVCVVVVFFVLVVVVVVVVTANQFLSLLPCHRDNWKALHLDAGTACSQCNSI